MLITILIIAFIASIGLQIFFDRRRWNYGTCKKCGTPWKEYSWSEMGDLYYTCGCGRYFTGHVYVPTRPMKKD